MMLLPAWTSVGEATLMFSPVAMELDMVEVELLKIRVIRLRRINTESPLDKE